MKTLIPKSEARKMVVQRRSEIAPSEIQTKTDRIIERFSQTDEFIHAKKIHCYIASRPGEVETHKLIDFMQGWGKEISVPKLNRKSRTFIRGMFMGWDHVTKNSEGYFEPYIGVDEELTDIDLFIVPALAVSFWGQRVGYGGGYYDKMLNNTFADKFVLAFEFQLFDYIESRQHDIRIDKIITERRVIDTRNPFGYQIPLD